MTASKAKQAQTALRRAEHLELALAGKSNAEIAEALDMKSAQVASKDLWRILDRAKKKEALTVEQYRTMNERRLLALLAAVWPKATSETELNIPAAEQARKLIADLNKLFGVDMPVKAELSGPDGGDIPLAGGSLAILNKLITIAGDGTEADDDEEPGTDDSAEDAGADEG